MTLNEYSLLMDGYSYKVKDEYRNMSLQAFRTAQAMSLSKKTSFDEFMGKSDKSNSSDKFISENVHRNN